MELMECLWMDIMVVHDYCCYCFWMVLLLCCLCLSGWIQVGCLGQEKYVLLGEGVLIIYQLFILMITICPKIASVRQPIGARV